MRSPLRPRALTCTNLNIGGGIWGGDDGGGGESGDGAGGEGGGGEGGGEGGGVRAPSITVYGDGVR